MPDRRAPHLLILAIALVVGAMLVACSGRAPRRPLPSPDSGVFVPTPISPPGGLPTALPTAVLPPPNVEAVHFIDARHGWLIEAAPNDAARLVLETTDSGATWTVVSHMSNDVYRLDFVDALHGWASSGNALLATSDGGRSWSTIREGDHGPSGIALVTPDFGWVVVHGTSVAMTADAGRTWVDVAPPCKPDRYHQPGLFVAFADASNGLFACTMGAGAGWQGKVLYSTHDGGATWAEIPNALGSGEYLHAIGDAAGIAWYTTLEPAGANIHLSLDGGATWTNSDVLGNREHLNWVNSAQFLDAMDGWVVVSRDSASGPGVLLATVDGGASWTAVAITP